MHLRPWHLVLAAGAPLALVAALWLRLGAGLPDEARLLQSRSGLEDAARRHAASLGIDTHNASVWVKIAERAEARLYAVRERDPGVLARLDPGFPAEVTLSNGVTGFTATFNTVGDLLGFDITNEQLEPPPDMPEEDVRAAAEEFVHQWLGFAEGATVGPLTASTRGRGFRFTFPVEIEGRPGAKFSGFVMMHGAQPLAARLRPEFSTSFAQRYRKPRAVRNTFSVLAALISTLLTLYALVLFRRRVREKEAPLGRIRVLVAAFALLGGIQIALNFESVAKVDAEGELLPWYSAVLAGAGGGLLMGVGGLLVGAAYAAGEGQIREGFPGKMTSFDALLAGRARNQNVGRSVAAGATVAAWALLLMAAGEALLDPRGILMIPDSLVHSAYGKLPFAATAAELPLGATFALVAGVFMPLTFALRNLRAGWRRWAVLLGCAFVITAGFAENTFTSPARLWEMLLQVAVLVAPFFLVDLLASLTATLLFLLALNGSALAAIAPWMLPGVALQLGVATAVLAVLASSWRSGEVVSEDEVKPQYARNLDQRLSMRSEISAAREAQLRLLPASPPPMPGLSLAAACRPTGDVGADFYDFFPLPGGRLAVFVASGGGLGVASALTIALAKGYLMSDLRRGGPPEESLARLRRLLTGRLGEVAQRARFALVHVDVDQGLIEAARWGEAPALWHIRAQGAVEEVDFHDGHHGLVVARCRLTSGDGLILHTEGLISALEDQSSTGVRQWFEQLCAQGTMDASRLHALLLEKLTQGKEKTLQRRLRSDLTTVVARLEQPALPLQKETAA